MACAWRNLKNIFSRPLFTIIFRPEMLKFHPYSILTGDTLDGFVIFFVLTLTHHMDDMMISVFTHQFFSQSELFQEFQPLRWINIGRRVHQATVANHQAVLRCNKYRFLCTESLKIRYLLKVS